MAVATQIKKGMIVILDGELYKAIKLTHITPGKGNAVVQADLRNIKTGVKTNKRFRSSEVVETAEITTLRMQFLYQEAEIFHFMDQASYEQFELTTELLGDGIHYLVADSTYEVEVYEDQPIGIALPARVTLKIVETDPSQKGVQGKTKPATTATGLVIKVPLFLQSGEDIIVNTESNEYVERA